MALYTNATLVQTNAGLLGRQCPRGARYGSVCKRPLSARVLSAVDGRASVVEVEVKESGLSGAGLGVFALRDFEAGSRLTQYAGEAEPPETPPRDGLITMDILAERCLARAREYSLELDDGRTLVGATESSDPSRVGHMVNDAGCITAGASFAMGAAGALEAYISAIMAGANVRLEVGGGRGDTVAARAIRAGEELLTSYSSPWWLAKLGAELQWRARRAASQDDATSAQAAWELLEEFEMASAMYAPLELEALRDAGLFSGDVGAGAQLSPYVRPPSPELDETTPVGHRLAVAAMQWKATSAPMRRRLIRKYGLEE